MSDEDGYEENPPKPHFDWIPAGGEAMADGKIHRTSS